MNPKKGRRKKPQRGSATRITPRESNFKGAEKPQGSRNCGGGKADRKVERGTRSQIPQREIKKSGESAKTAQG